MCQRDLIPPCFPNSRRHQALLICHISSLLFPPFARRSPTPFPVSSLLISGVHPVDNVALTETVLGDEGGARPRCHWPEHYGLCSSSSERIPVASLKFINSPNRAQRTKV